MMIEQYLRLRDEFENSGWKLDVNRCYYQRYRLIGSYVVEDTYLDTSKRGKSCVYRKLESGVFDDKHGTVNYPIEVVENLAYMLPEDVNEEYIEKLLLPV